METLDQRIARLAEELATYEGRDNLTQDEIDRKNWLSNQHAEALLDQKSQQQREQAIEEKVHDEIKFTIQGVNLSELPPEMIMVVEMIVKADRRRIYAEHALELEQIEDESAAYKAQAELKISNQDKALEALRQDYETCARELNEQEAETIRLVAERDDYKTKLANAAAQLDEKDSEISRLKSEIEDYQKAKMYGERQAQNIIEVNSSEVNDINNAIAKAKESLEQKANRALARWDLAPVELPTLPAPVSPFRNDTETQPSVDTIPSAETPAPVESQFQESPMAIPASGESQEEVVTKAEFEALSQRVAAIEERFKPTVGAA